MNYFIYTSHHFTPHGKIWTQLIDLAPNVWLHSSVGRGSHRYRGGHGFESNPIEALNFFRLLLSSCSSWKINCDDHSPLSWSVFHKNLSLKRFLLAYVRYLWYAGSLLRLNFTLFRSSLWSQLRCSASEYAECVTEFLGSEQSSTPWPHFGLKYAIETSFQSWISSRIR